MSRFITCGLSLVLLAAIGCNNKDGKEQALRQQERGVKPVVAVVPMIDNTIQDLPWSLSDELMSSLLQRLIQDDKLYVVEDQKVRSMLKKAEHPTSPFGPNLGWIKKAFAEDEFVVFMEILEHQEVPLYAAKPASAQESPANLNTTIRIRIFDLTKEKPEVVLQEMIHDSHHIPRQFTRANFSQIPWGREDYPLSPMGLAHAHLVKEIASRLEDYILLANRD